jgi:hypothetical protein
MFARLAAAAALSLGLVTGAFAGEPTGGTKIFKDWMAACDNLASCSAFGFQGESFTDSGFIVVQRAAGPAAPLKVSIVLPPLGDETPSGQISWSAVLDGERLAAFSKIAARPDDNGYWRADLAPAQGAAFLDAVRDGDELILTRGRDQAGRFSLAGVTATLLWVEETQDRIGTPSALLRKGTRPSPPAPTAPFVTRGPEVSQAGLPKVLPRGFAALPDLKECDVDYAVAEDLTIARLSPGTLLWAVPCSRGAYNTIYAMLLTDEAGGQIRHAVFPHTPGAGQDQSGELMNISYDPKTRILSNFDKARGFRDCGARS